ncbi:mechanosensitive ion channel family protein [Chloroflexota bacterium]
MIPQFVSGSPLLEGVWSAGVLVGFFLLAWLVLLGMKYTGRRLAKRSKNALIPQLLQCLTRPIFLLIISQGILLALGSLSFLSTWSNYLTNAAIAFVLIIVTYGLARSGRLLLGWYLRRVKVRLSLIRLLERFTMLLIYICGLLILFDYLGIAISPMIAGLGLSGLAVALALQPTLSNFFAGTQIVSDRVVHVGDYIELDSGATGYVIDIGWRSTRVRTTYNNLMIIPNSRLVDSIITNYHSPDMELAVIVESGVSYSSDLAKVENIVLKIARGIIEELPETVKTREPWFGYDEFGDSNINFWVWLYAKDRLSAFRIKSELIKHIHTSFAEEGITINYPTRMITYEDSQEKRPVLPPDESDAG